MMKIIPAVLLAAVLFAGCGNKQQYKATLVEIMSTGCAPCAELKPAIEELKKEYKGSVKFVIYDVKTSEGSEKASVYMIKGTPTLVFLDENGMEYFRLEKTMQKDIIAAILNTKTGPLPPKK